MAYRKAMDHFCSLLFRAWFSCRQSHLEITPLNTLIVGGKYHEYERIASPEHFVQHK